MKQRDIEEDATSLFSQAWVIEIFRASPGESQEDFRQRALYAAAGTEALGFEVSVARYDENTYMVGQKKPVF